MDLLRCPFHQAVLGTTLVAAASIYALLRSPGGSLLPVAIPSPRTDLEKLTKQEISRLPYPPDLYPGGRWVNTPYGVIRVYEFGPETGRKVVFVHGIGTPCCVARDLMWELVEEGGCRVLIFDLYGRGYSDSPLLTPHDSRLYSSQILFAVTSSQLHWASFTLIGYSFGGGVAVAFTHTFPHMVNDLVLLAPAGIVKSSRLGVFSRMAQAGWVPGAVAGFMATKRTHGTPSEEVLEARRRKADPKDRRTVVDIEGVVEWQGKAHKGYLQSFLSSFRTGPIFDREVEWAEVGERWKEEGKRVYILIGEEDAVIDPELLPEMLSLLRGEGGGEKKDGERVTGRLVEKVGHDMVVRRGRELAREIREFWKGDVRVLGGWTEFE